MTKIGDVVGEMLTQTSASDSHDVKPEERRVQGKIIKISDEGWGFISSRDVKFTRIFFHWTSLKQNTMNFTDLKNGMKVEFTPIEVENKGWRAIKIVVIKDEAPAPVEEKQ